MDFKKLFIEVSTIFTITLVVSVGVTFLWGIAFHDISKIDWETSFRFAIIFAIIIPYINSRNKSKK